MSVKYSLQTSQNMVPRKCQCQQTLTVFILKYATEFYHNLFKPNSGNAPYVHHEHE